MTVLQDIEKLIVRLAPEPICDNCIDRTLQLAGQDHAEQLARELAGSKGLSAARKSARFAERSA